MVCASCPTSSTASSLRSLQIPLKTVKMNSCNYRQVTMPSLILNVIKLWLALSNTSLRQEKVPQVWHSMPSDASMELKKHIMTSKTQLPLRLIMTTQRLPSSLTRTRLFQTASRVLLKTQPSSSLTVTLKVRPSLLNHPKINSFKLDFVHSNVLAYTQDVSMRTMSM